MNCENALELLSAALDGELSATEEAQLQAHLDHCPHCRAIQEELAGIHAACGEMEVPPPAALKESIMANLPPQRPAKVVYWKRWGAMAAALALVALAAWRLPHFLYEKQAPATTDIADIEALQIAEVTEEDAAEAGGAGDPGDAAPIVYSAWDAGIETAAAVAVNGNADAAPDAPRMDIMEAAASVTTGTVDYGGLTQQPSAKRAGSPAAGGGGAEPQNQKESVDTSSGYDTSGGAISPRSLFLDPVYEIDDSDTDVIAPVLPAETGLTEDGEPATQVSPAPVVTFPGE